MITSDVYPFLLAEAATGAAMLLLPHFSPRRFFFAITVPAGFRSSADGRASLRRYSWTLAAAVLISAALTLWLGSRSPGAAGPLSVFLPMGLGFASFLRERGQVRRHAAPAPTVRIAVADADLLPHWIWLMLPPFLLPLGGAAWLRSHGSEIPLRFPLHWDAAGQADRWASKGLPAVYAPLLVCAGVLFFLLLVNLATFYGARRMPQRIVFLKIMVVLMYCFGLMFCGMALAPVLQVSPLWFLVPLPAALIVILIWASLRHRPRAPGRRDPGRVLAPGSDLLQPARPGSLCAEAHRIRLHHELRQPADVASGGFAGNRRGGHSGTGAVNSENRSPKIGQPG